MTTQSPLREDTDRPSATPDSATIRFRRDQVSSGVARVGRLRPGGLLKIEYDALRLITDNQPRDIVCHVRFEPGGQERSATLQFATSTAQSLGGRPRPAAYETQIPSDAQMVELWFERRDASGSDGWDSRFGRNFRFRVLPSGLPVPDESVLLRPDVVIEPSRISVVDDAASKARSATSSTASALGTELKISAKISGAVPSSGAWADFHIFDATDELVHAGTLELRAPDETSGQGGVQTWSANVYQGSGGGSGAGVWSRPDAHSIQYRLYCQIGEQVVTDGVLHQFDLPPDAEVRPIPGSW